MYRRVPAGDVQYDWASFEIVSVRDGLDTERFTQRVEHSHDTLSHRPTEARGDDSFGKPSAALSVRESAVVLHARWSPTEGNPVGRAPGAAYNLVDFIHESMERWLPDGPPASHTHTTPLRSSLSGVVLRIIVTTAHQKRCFVDVNPGFLLECGETALTEQLLFEDCGGFQYQREALGRRTGAVKTLTIHEVLLD